MTKPLTINNEPRPQSDSGWKNYIGIILTLLCTITYSLATLCLKILKEYDPINLTFWRFQGVFLPSLLLLLYYYYYEKDKILTPLRPFLQKDKIGVNLQIFIRSILGCTTTIFHIYAIQYISMADASVILYSCPIFVALGAHISLGEKCGLTHVVIAVFTMFGVLLITRPPVLTGEAAFNENTLIGSAFAFMAMIMTAIIFIMLRHLRKVHFSIMLFNYGFWGTVESCVLALCTSGLTLPKEMEHVWIFAGLIIFTFISQVCVIGAFKFENATAVSLLSPLDVVYAFLWEFLFFGIVPDVFSIGGAGIVLSGAVIITLQKWVTSLPVERKERKVLKFLLM